MARYVLGCWHPHPLELDEDTVEALLAATVPTWAWCDRCVLWRPVAAFDLVGHPAPGDPRSGKLREP